MKNGKELEEMLESYKERLAVLEEENRQLRKYNRNLEDGFREVLEKMHYPMLVTDIHGVVLFENRPFTALLDYAPRQLSEQLGGLRARSIQDLLSGGVYDVVRDMIASPEQSETRVVRLRENDYLLNVYDIRKGKFKFLSFRPVVDLQVGREELVLRLQEVIDRNLKMVQNISFTMGEDTAAISSILNSIVRHLK